MQPPKEQQILKVILSYLALCERKGELFYFRSASGGVKTAEGRFFRTGRAGVPDITILKGGRFIGLEVKRPSLGKQSTEQVEIEKLIKQSGGEYHIVTSLEQAVKVLL